jgi:Protein of unknown function (DUF2934)
MSKQLSSTTIKNLSDTRGSDPAGSNVPFQRQEEMVRRRAYELWLERGCPEGSPDDDWYRAEQEFAFGAELRVKESSDKAERAMAAPQGS